MAMLTQRDANDHHIPGLFADRLHARWHGNGGAQKNSARLHINMAEVTEGKIQGTGTLALDNKELLVVLTEIARWQHGRELLAKVLRNHPLDQLLDVVCSLAVTPDGRRAMKQALVPHEEEI